jgi:hypothetical protein
MPNFSVPWGRHVAVPICAPCETAMCEATRPAGDNIRNDVRRDPELLVAARRMSRGKRQT